MPVPKGDFDTKPVNQDIEAIRQLVYERPTKSDIADGFIYDGATTIPRTPTILRCYSNHNSIHVVWDRQEDLTNFSHYEVQVSEGDNRPWYALSFDGYDWKDDDFDYAYYTALYEADEGVGALPPLTMNDLNTEDYTIIYTPYIEHCNIPYNSDKTGKRLYYRVRVVTKADVKSQWSEEAYAITRLIQRIEYLAGDEFVYLGDGSIDLSGAALTLNWSDFIGDGTIQLSGAATDEASDYIYLHSGSGVLNFSGDAEELEGANYSKSGTGHVDFGGGSAHSWYVNRTVLDYDGTDAGPITVSNVILTPGGTPTSVGGFEKGEQIIHYDEATGQMIALRSAGYWSYSTSAYQVEYHWTGP